MPEVEGDSGEAMGGGDGVYGEGVGVGAQWFAAETPAPGLGPTPGGTVGAAGAVTLGAGGVERGAAGVDLPSRLQSIPLRLQ